MTEHKLDFKLAQPHDGNMLSRMAQDSKSYWGYTEDLMKVWEEELILEANYIKSNIVYKILVEDELIGFYALRYLDLENCFEIDHLWLKPSHIQRGFGRQIFFRIHTHLKNLGQRRALLKGDPHAAGFYEKMRGKLVSEVESKVKGRFLPLYEFNVQEVIDLVDSSENLV